MRECIHKEGEGKQAKKKNGNFKEVIGSRENTSKRVNISLADQELLNSFAGLQGSCKRVCPSPGLLRPCS